MVLLLGWSCSISLRARNDRLPSNYRGLARDQINRVHTGHEKYNFLHFDNNIMMDGFIIIIFGVGEMDGQSIYFGECLGAKGGRWLGWDRS